MTSSRLEYLFNNYIHFQCTEKEKEELMALLSQSENKPAILELIGNTIHETKIEVKISEEVADTILQEILHTEKKSIVPLRPKEWRIGTRMRRVAAAAIIIFAIASYWIIEKGDKGNEKERIAVVDKSQTPIVPGGNRATLTMSDGSTIDLDSLKNGSLQYGSTQINKLDGILVYHPSSSSEKNDRILYNTLSTPRGGQFEVVLPDGSKVWLNAASSIRFPTAFTGDLREVELKGEAYFEVAKNLVKPFRVKVDKMSVNVLGTHFNINAYSDENSIKTSLLEGSIKIDIGNKSELLQPGNQAILNRSEDKLEMEKFNPNEVMAWRNDIFHFEGADIRSIMREIGRWYDVEITFSGKMPDRSFQGKISRNAELSEVLRILELNDIKFVMEGRKIIIQ